MVGETTGKYEVVISGVAGQFPEADGFQELADKLNNKVDFISCNNSKWTPGELDVPAGTGKMKNSNGFDLTFFGIHQKLCEIMDPHIRLCLERSYEAICDAGYNPGELSGSNTAVLMASMTSETEYGSVTVAASSGYGMLGHSRTMQANRISYILNLHGPSFVMDSSWTGGMQGLELAHRLISEGQINAALVGVCSLIFRPEVSFHYDRMGKLNHDGKTKSFSDDADGYCRSEACVVLLMQRADDARRSYCTLEGVLAHNYGSRESSLTTSSPNYYAQMLKQLYQKIDLDRLAFVELDGSAAKKVDAMELNGLDEVICSGRKRPLLVGSVKSNLGHTEAASSFVSLAKAVIALDSGIIPPNLHYSQPNSQVEALKAGRIQVVTEPTPLEGDLVGVSCIGIVGTYSHAILRRNPKQKARLTSKGTFPPDRLPRLVVMSGREETKLLETFDKIEAMPVDEEFIALTHHVFKKDIPKHLFRGFTLINEDLSVDRQIQTHVGGKKRPVWFVFSGMGSQWPGMGTHLMKLPVFAEAINKCQRVLQPKGVDVIDIITNPDPSTFDTILHSFVGIAAVQIGLVDVLKTLQIEPDGIVGHSVGELGCAYADGCFTAEQMILSAYARGRASVETKLIKGMMAAVGLGYKEIKDQLPEGIEVACHNSSESCTLSGPEKEMQAYIGELKERGIFAKLVNVANIAYHSKHIAPAAPALLRYLKEVIPSPKARSARWVSSSVGESGWSSELAKYSSAEYHTNNLLSSVLFEEASSHIPSEAIVIEIAPHGLLQAILRRSLPNTVTNIPLTNKTNSDPITFLLTAFAKMYAHGVDVDLTKVYPAVPLPVSPSTNYTHNLLTWDTSNITPFDLFSKKLGVCPSYEEVTINLVGEDYQEYSDLTINDRTILSTAKYLELVVNMYRGIHNRLESESPVTISNFTLHREVEVLPKRDVKLYIQIQRGSGGFEILEGESLVAEGEASFSEGPCLRLGEEETLRLEDVCRLNGTELYGLLAERGHRTGPSLRRINSALIHSKGVKCSVRLEEGGLVGFLESVLSCVSLSAAVDDSLQLVRRIHSLTVHPALINNTSQRRDFELTYWREEGVLKCEGLEMVRPMTGPPFSQPSETHLSLQRTHFVPYQNAQLTCLQEGVDIAMGIASERGVPSLSVQAPSSPSDHFNTIQEHLADLIKSKGFTGKGRGQVLDKMVLSEDLTALQEEATLFLVTGVPPHSIPANLTLLFSAHHDRHHLSLYRQIVAEEKEERVVVAKKGESAVDLSGKGGVVLVSRAANLREAEQIISSIRQPNVRHLVLDEPAAEFKDGKAAYSDWLSKGLRENVLVGGVWGSLHCPPPLEYSPGPPLSTHSIQDIKMDRGKVTSVCLNPVDLTGRWTNNNQCGVVEYRLEGGEVGLGVLRDDGTLIPDPQLKWRLPQPIYPLPYAIGYYMFEEVKRLRRGDGVLVTEGQSPLSQAIIRVALSKTERVYTTCLGQRQRDSIRAAFPQLSEDKIWSHGEKGFGSRLVVGCGGLKMKIIVSSLAGHRLESLLDCLAFQGHFFQLDTTPMREHQAIGLKVFRAETGMFGVRGGNLLQLSPERKERIAEAVSRGVETGVVLPLPTFSVSPHLSVQQAIRTIHSRYSEGREERLVVRLDSAGNANRYTCHPDGIYLLLVDGECGGAEVDLVDWIQRRGGRNVLLHSELNLNQLTQFRLRKKSGVEVLVSTRAQLQARLHSPPNLIFALTKGQGDDVYAKGRELSVRWSKRGDVEVVLLCGGVRGSAPGRLLLVPDLPLSAALHSLDEVMLLPPGRSSASTLRQTNLQQTPVRRKGVEFEDEDLLPGRLAELREVCGGTKVGLVEVSTLSPRQLHSRELSPVFLLPGLAPSHLRSLASTLIYPAFLATLPARFTHIDSVASALAKEMVEKFNQEMYTVVCVEWSGGLGVRLARALEREYNKKVCLVLIEATPSLIGPALADRLPRLQPIINNILIKEESEEREEAERYREVLEERVNSLCRLEPGDRMSGMVYLVRTGHASETDRANIHQWCSGKVKVEIVEGAFSLRELVARRETAQLINRVALYENTDVVSKQRYFTSEEILFDATDNTPGIRRV